MSTDQTAGNADPLPPGATVAAVVVPVPEAELVVARCRGRFDPAAARGVPAHVTVLYPFVAPAALDDGVVTRLGEAVGGVPTFECGFREVRWFDNGVAWLRPEPDAPFRALTAAVARAFPDHPPYAGAHDPVPHLTLGDAAGGAVDPELREAVAQVARMLPVRRCRVAEVHLMAGAQTLLSWRTLARLPLAPA